MFLATLLDLVPYAFALLTGLFAGILVGVWLIVTGRITFLKVPEKIIQLPGAGS